MPTTVLVEPDPGGHRFQTVALVAAVAGRTDHVMLLTSRGATETPAFRELLGEDVATGRVRVLEVFDEIYPPTREMARAAADVCRRTEVSNVVVMDADQSLKRWWLDAPREFWKVRPRPRVVFMLTRYPAELRLTDWAGWRLRLPKAGLAVAAMATGSLHRAAGFAGRDNTRSGWVVKRTRDPDICSAHARDRAAIRAGLGLPADRRIAGIYGVISERKNARLVWEAMADAGLDVDLLLGGKLDPEVRAWVDALPEPDRARIHVWDEFLPDDLIDRLVAAADVAPIILINNGPSGIMGKALAAGVPVVTAGSEVRARELVATDGGELADLTPSSIAAAVGRALRRDPDAPRRSTVPPATPEEYAETLLGVDAWGVIRSRRRR